MGSKTRVLEDPYRILLALEYVGNNPGQNEDQIIQYLREFAKNKKTAGADNVLTTLQSFNLVMKEEGCFTLTTSNKINQTLLYSGLEIFAAYISRDIPEAMRMLQTTILYYSPEIRSLATFIYRKRSVSKSEIGFAFDKKVVHNHKFNSFTIDTSLAELVKLGIIRINANKEYELANMSDLIFSQILVEEVITESPDKLVASSYDMKELFSLKFDMPYAVFDDYFNRIRKITMSNLIDTNNYGKFTINLDVAKQEFLYE